MSTTRFIRTNPVGLLNLEIKRSAYNAFAFDVYGEDEITPFDMTAYSGAKLEVKRIGNEPTAVIELTTEDAEITLMDGSVLLEFSELKSTIEARPYNFNFFVTDNGNEIVFISGIFKVNL